MSKKKKIYLGMSIVKESESCTPFTAGPLEEIGIIIGFIKELVSGLP